MIYIWDDCDCENRIYFVESSLPVEVIEPVLGERFGGQLLGVAERVDWHEGKSSQLSEAVPPSEFFKCPPDPTPDPSAPKSFGIFKRQEDRDAAFARCLSIAKYKFDYDGEPFGVSPYEPWFALISTEVAKALIGGWSKDETLSKDEYLQFFKQECSERGLL